MNIFTSTSMFIEIGLARRQQWWPEWRPLSLVVAIMKQTRCKHHEELKLDSYLVLMDHNIALRKGSVKVKGGGDE